MKKTPLLFTIVLIVLVFRFSFGQEADNSATGNQQNTAARQDNSPNLWEISFYQPNYLLPLYYTQDPDNAAYAGQGYPNIDHYEAKFQFSFKYPLTTFKQSHTLYFAYTQMSYWQAYASSAFFRSTDYEPELFLDNQTHLPLVDKLELDNLNVGAMHQSNGEGGDLERSWNRAYLNFIADRNNLMIGFQPWYILHDHATEKYNPDIGHYMGYEQAVIAYRYASQVFALQARNTLESGFQRSGITLTWSFPIGIDSLKGYLQAFSGYGQSLIEYDHRTNAIGIGISLNDWLNTNP